MKHASLSFASLFSGCGGFDLGFIREGFSSRAAYDCDSEAVDSFKANFSSPIYDVDLTEGVPRENELRDIDVLIAGPPCQGFSTAGKRQIDDKRNHLLTLTGHLASRISPKVLIVENVAGALSGAHARYWHELDATMRQAGYRTNTIRCQATDVGMAQLRRRILFFAWKTKRDIDFTIQALPPKDLRSVLDGVQHQANHHPKKLIPQSREWQIARRIKAGQKLSNVRGGENAVATWDIPEVFGAISDHERTILEVLRRLRRQNRLRDHGDADPVSLCRLESALGKPFVRLVDDLVAKGYLRRVGPGIDLVGTFNGKFRRLAWDKPSCTVDTRFGSPRYFLHPSQPRGFTVREAARIQGFDDGYTFHGSELGQYRQVGNAVPPPLGALAARLAKRLLGA